MSIDGFRVPLQEQKNEINTPLPFKSSNNQKITTPPESISNIRRKNVDNMETPLKNYDNYENFDNFNKNLLLSPAFSSPQTQMKYNVTNGVNYYQYLKPAHQQMQQNNYNSFGSSNDLSTYNSSPPHSHSQGNLSSFDDEFDQEKPKKKKSKKDKKAFDIQSTDKPPYSYATLIGMSILSHPDKRLTLSSIYLWISDTFKYYKKEDVGWQNSIRHNLSLNKAFIKGEKSKDGKGHFWCIEDGCEDQFLKLRNNKKSSYQEIMEQIQLHKSQSNNVPKYKEESVGVQSQRKRSMYSIPSSPNRYDAKESTSFSKLSEAADYHRLSNRRDNESTEDEEYLYSNKKQKLSDKENDYDAPYMNNWNLSPQQVKVSKPAMDILSTPNFMVTDSPNKPLVAGKNLTFTSSFSCNSNLELSPIRPNETGPLLEPLTPGKVYKSGAMNHHLNVHFSSGTPLLGSGNHSNAVQSKDHEHSDQTPSTSQINHQVSKSESQSTQEDQTHSSQNQNLSNNLNIPPSNYLQNNGNQFSHSRQYSGSFNKTPKSTSKTPLRVLKTPQTNLKKLWNSPGYLDDFYYSPLITSQSALHSYDDDDMILRAFESPANNYKKVSSMSLIESSSRTLFHERKLSGSMGSIEKIDETK